MEKAECRMEKTASAALRLLTFAFRLLPSASATFCIQHSSFSIQFVPGRPCTATVSGVQSTTGASGTAVTLAIRALVATNTRGVAK